MKAGRAMTRRRRAGSPWMSKSRSRNAFAALVGASVLVAVLALRSRARRPRQRRRGAAAASALPIPSTGEAITSRLFRGLDTGSGLARRTTPGTEARLERLRRVVLHHAELRHSSVG